MPVQVESIMAGDGKHYPHERQTVTLHYVGYLDRAGQKKFDSTFERGTCMQSACIRGGEHGPCHRPAS
jgi:FKBP-type peptidyl-prolyl cis-trans isomerase